MQILYIFFTLDNNPNNFSGLFFRLFFALTLEYGVAAEVVLERKGWRAKEHLARLADISDHATLGADGRVVGDVQMPRYADLAGEDAVLAYFGGAGDSALGGHHGVVADLDIVGDLAEVVDLDPVADDRGFHLGLVDGRPGADLDIVADDDIADVLDLLPSPVRERRVAESVGSDDSVGVDDHIVADDHSRIDDDSRVDDAMRADHGVVADIDILVDLRVVPHLGVMPDIRMASEIDLLAELGGQEP